KIELFTVKFTRFKMALTEPMGTNFGHLQVDWMYFVAFAGTAIGLIIYSYKGSREAAEDTAQVTGATDEEAATENHGAERVPGAGEDDGPDTNKSPSEAATSR
uniref:Uncharacterized protein n=1 Tax=Aegilops tauschii subsp. strangulata TaxID=200361 RepID=A0A453LAK7_AEGTS